MLTEDIAAAVQKLSKALDRARLEWDRSSDGGRRAMMRVLAAASDFICVVAPECGRKYDKFIMVLIAAFDGLDQGAVVPMLKHKNIGRGRRTGFARLQLDLHAAATMKSLMDVGIKRTDAAKKVSDLLRRCGVPNATVRSVTDCYDQQKQSWHILYAAGTNEHVNEGRRKRLTNNEIRDRLLSNLASIVAIWQPVPRKAGTEETDSV